MPIVDYIIYMQYIYFKIFGPNWVKSLPSFFILWRGKSFISLVRNIYLERILKYENKIQNNITNRIEVWKLKKYSSQAYITPVDVKYNLFNDELDWIRRFLVEFSSSSLLPSLFHVFPRSRGAVYFENFVSWHSRWKGGMSNSEMEVAHLDFRDTTFGWE